MPPTVAILMPVGGDDCPHRARAREYVVDRYSRLHGGWPLLLGHCGEPWSKGAAIADAYRQIGETVDVVLLADADSFVDPESVELAVDGAVRDGWAMPHAMVLRLDEAGTADVYAGAEPNPRKLTRGAYRGVRGGGIVAVRSDVFADVNGIDPRFYGWGGEDISFAMAVQCLHGRYARFAGDLWHLWHPHPAPDLRGSAESEALVERYREAQNRPSVMRALVSEWSLS